MISKNGNSYKLLLPFMASPAICPSVGKIYAVELARNTMFDLLRRRQIVSFIKCLSFITADWNLDLYPFFQLGIILFHLSYNFILLLNFLFLVLKYFFSIFLCRLNRSSAG